MSADARVVPVRDQHRAIGCDSDVRWPGPGVVSAVHDVFGLRGVTSAFVDDLVPADDAFARLGVEQLTAILCRQQRPLIDGEATRRSVSEPENWRRDARQLHVPVRAAILEPGLVQRTAKAVVAPFHVVEQPRPRVAVIVVVGLEDVAERVDGHLVRIPEVLAEHLEAGAVGVDAQDDAFEIADARPRVRARPLREETLARFVGNVEAGVALIEVQLAVEAEDDRVQTVIVIRSAKARQQHLALDDVVVGVLRIDDQIRRL